ncbi:MAG: hypothetical protein ACTSYH_03385 [Candidatus Heimdallarchaeaceae archaeon]
MDTIIINNLADEINLAENAGELRDLASRAYRVASISDVGYRSIYTALALKAAHKANLSR